MKSELTGKPCSENIIRLYRGTSKKGYTKYVANTVFSATWNREVAANFGDVVYELLNVTASDILIDTTLFTPDEIQRNGGFPEEMDCYRECTKHWSAPWINASAKNIYRVEYH